MARFIMENTPFCLYCGDANNVETIRHLLWECPRSRDPWEYQNLICRRAYNEDYIN